jgi:hypothetical protein
MRDWDAQILGDLPVELRVKFCRQFSQGSAIAQAVGSRFPTAMAQVRPRLKSCGISLGKFFSDYLCFPCQFSFRQIIHTHLSSATSTMGLPVVGVQTRLSLTPPSELNEYSREPGGPESTNAMIDIRTEFLLKQKSIFPISFKVFN